MKVEAAASTERRATDWAGAAPFERLAAPSQKATPSGGGAVHRAGGTIYSPR